MKKILAISLVFIASIHAQVENIPYDWTGQYGALSHNGQILWNQDWQVGPLLFDGTFSNYPLRYGKTYYKNLSIKELGNTISSDPVFPDSSNIWSIADYYRGDYSYDQLEMNLNFEEKNRIISINGFKRTYKGPWGQYLAQDESSNPLQQSYRLDYLSKNDQESINLSIGYFHTDSRMKLSDPADFRHREETLSFGTEYVRNLKNWESRTYLAASQQYYLMRFDTTQYYRPEYDTTKAHLNRTHLSQVFSRSLSEHSSINIGLELDAQSLKQKLPDDAKINRLWSIIYGDFNLHSSNIRLGVTLSEKEAHPVIKISNFLKMNNVGSIKSGIYYYAKPSHLYRLDSKGMEKWLNVNVIGEFNFNKLPLSIRLDFVNTDSEMSYRYAEDLDAIDLSNNLITSTIGTMLPIIRDWKIEINYRHTFNTNIYADGIGDKIKIGLNIAERLFKNNMSLNFNLWTEGYLNHNNKIGYDAFHFGPFATDNINYDLPDYWVFNLDLAVRVSKLTFGWRVNNILNTFEGLTEQILPDLGEEYLLITNNLNFPPMSRFVSFNIIWEFDN